MSSIEKTSPYHISYAEPRNSFITSMCSLNDISSKDDVIFETVNNAGIITLNRPEALNALNYSMVSKILARLQDWETTKTLVVIKGAGGKAFCAGGDVKAAIDRAEGPRFFSKEFNVIHLIGRYSIPYVALINGITMGGGLGVSVHGRYRVATENTVVAMPETRIGLIPDVGGSYFLPRLDNNLGLYLGLTGNRLKAKDVVKASIATHFVSSQLLPELETLLSHCSNEREVSSVLNQYSEPCELSSLSPYVNSIDYCFGGRTVEEIMERLGEVNDGWSNQTLETLHSVCPGSLKSTLLAMQHGRSLDLGACLKMEYRLVCHAFEHLDFSEGVRALLIDKDKRPQWNPRTLAEVTDEYVNSFFEKLPEELVFIDE